jgi:sucrose phosphorylase
MDEHAATSSDAGARPLECLQLLESVYPPEAIAALGPRLAALLERSARTPVTAASALRAGALDERDAILITYADQVTQPGIAPLRALAEFCAAHLRGLIQGVHVLPFYPSSSDDGFSVMDYYAVDPAWGTWADLQRLGQSFDLMFDAVFNHMSAQGAWFQRFLRAEPEFRDFFVTVEGAPDLSQVIRPRALPLLTEFATARGPRRVWTTFSADQVDLNFSHAAVLLAIVEVLLFYVAQGARFIRLDAIAFLWKEIGTPCLHRPQTHRIIQFLRAVLDAVAPHVFLITETNVPHAENLSYFGDGTNEAQLVYNFALPPLVLHSLATGDAGALTRWAESLVLPSDRTTFFNFLASHDGIGLNPARGILSEAEIRALADRALKHGGFISYKGMPDGSRAPYELNINYLDALSDPQERQSDELAVRRFLTAQAVMLCLPGVPGIYFHSLFGSRGDRAAAESSGLPRRINRAKLDRARLEAELGEPASLRRQVLDGYARLLRFRRAHPAFAPGAAHRVLALDPRVFAVLRRSAGGDTVLCLHNMSEERVRVVSPELAPAGVPLVPLGTEWVEIQ